MKFPNLFSPLVVGGIELRNRIFSSAHGTGLAEGSGLSQVDRGLPGKRLFNYHSARAKGGVALIVAENTVVFPRQPGWIEAWRPIIDEVHSHGTKIFNQITYGGRQVSGAEMLRPPYAPSPIPWMRGGEYPREMSRTDIKNMVRSFGATARDVAAGGFDGVELHGPHGYLIHEFLSPDANRRSDEYGGSVRNRARFALEIIEAVREQLPPSTVFGMRMSAEEGTPGGLELDEALEVIDLLKATGALDYFSISAGTYKNMERIIPGMYQPRAINAQLGKAVKQRVNVPVFLAGRINDPGLADQLIAEGCADMVAMTRSLIADPELPRKAEEGRLDDIRYCLGANQGCWGRVRARYPIGCVYNPAAGREGEFSDTAPAVQPKQLLVIGGGPAGCETARQAAMRGHRVTLFEKEATLGGATALAALAPGREDFAEVSRWFTHELSRLGVEVQLGTEVTPQSLPAHAPDEVVLATGAVPLAPEINGLDACDFWLTMPEAMKMKFDPGDLAVIFTVSREIDILTLADKLACTGGTQVVMITPHDSFGRNVDESTIASIMSRLHVRGVRLVPFTDLHSVDGNSVTTRNIYSGAISKLSDVDTLVIDAGWSPRRGLEGPVRTAYPGATITIVGDCLAPRGLQAAVWDGARAGRRS